MTETSASPFAELRRWRRLHRRASIGFYLCFVLEVSLLWFAHDHIEEYGGSSRAAALVLVGMLAGLIGLICMGFRAAAALRLRHWRCPACGRLFCRSVGLFSGRLFDPRCAHCGMHPDVNRR